MNSIGGVTDALYDFIYGTDWQGVMAQMSAGFDAVARFVEPVTLALQNLWAVAEPVTMAMYNAITKQLASPESQAALTQTGVIFRLLGDILMSVVAIAIDGMRVSFLSFYQTFAMVWPYVQTALNLWMQLMAPFQTLVVGVLTAISMALRGDFAGAWDTVKTAITTFLTTINIAVSSWATSVVQTVTAVAGQLVSAAISVGSSIASGIAQGIANGASAIVSAAKSAAQSALDAAKAALGIASPSKVFADQVGFNISSGIAAGIARGVPDITGAIGGATGAAVGAVNQTTQNYYLSASYQTAQSESSIGNDLRAMQLLAGGMA
jgi:hypothetical protein